MLVPLVDMLNHGGDETNSGLLADPSHTSTDNVRCGIVGCNGLLVGGDGVWGGGEIERDTHQAAVPTAN